MTRKLCEWRGLWLQTAVTSACLVGAIGGPLSPVTRADSPVYVERSDSRITVGLDFSRLRKRSNPSPTNKLTSARSRSGAIEQSSSPNPSAKESANVIANAQGKASPTNSVKAVEVERPAQSGPVVFSGSSAGSRNVTDSYRQQRINDAVRSANQQMRDNQSGIVRGISNGADQGANRAFHPF